MEPEKTPTYEEIQRHMLDGGEVGHPPSGVIYRIHEGRLESRFPGYMEGWTRSICSFSHDNEWRLVTKVVSKWHNVYQDKANGFRLAIGTSHDTREIADRKQDADRLGVLRVDHVNGKVVARVLEPVEVS